MGSPSGSPTDLSVDASSRLLPHVFIIDDDRAILNLLRVILEDAGFAVRTYVQATAALSEIHRNPPDVIILDLEMPVMNGREFYREIRAAGVQSPVLVLSAFGAHAAQLELGR